MVNKYKVSVVVPVFNGEEYLRQCIDSIVRQTIFDQLEVILINDGSTDDTPLICDNYAREHSNIYVVHQQNQGLVASRKKGANIAKSKYITYVDADDWIDETYVESLLFAMESQECELVISDVRYEFGTHGENYTFAVEPGYYSSEQLSDFTSKYVYSGKFFSFGSPVCVWGKLFDLEKYRPFQERVPEILKIGEDVAVTIPYIASLKKGVVQLKNVYYHYRQSDNSMVHNAANFNRKHETDELYRCLNDSLTDRYLMKRLCYYKASMMIGLMRNDCNLQDNFRGKCLAIKTIVENEENKRIIKDLSFNTMSLKYKIFFKLFKMNLWFPLAFIIIMGK